jgi:hypothetical protein
MFWLRSGLKSEWIDSNLPENNSGWRSEWCYIVDQLLGLPRRSGHKPVKISEWDLGLSSHDTEDPKEILELVRDLKSRGVTGGFSCQVVLLVADLANQGLGSSRVCVLGQSNPTREDNCKVSKEEMAARVFRIYFGKVKIKKCAKAHSLKRPADPVSTGTCFRSFTQFDVVTSFNSHGRWLLVGT